MSSTIMNVRWNNKRLMQLCEEDGRVLIIDGFPPSFRCQISDMMHDTVLMSSSMMLPTKEGEFQIIFAGNLKIESSKRSQFSSKSLSILFPFFTLLSCGFWLMMVALLADLLAVGADLTLKNNIGRKGRPR